MSSQSTQYLAVICVNVIAIAYGCSNGWNSPAILLLRAEDSPLSTGAITVNEQSWIGAIQAVGAVFGNLLFGWVANRFGRKYPICILALPLFMSWMCIIVGTNIYYLYAAKILAGITGGGIYVLIPIYVAEIAEDNIRGRLGSLIILQGNSGVLIAYVAGGWLSYVQAPALCAAITVLFFVTFIFLPDTPQKLLLQNNEEAAFKSLKFYRGGTKQDGSDALRSEFERMKSIVKSEPSKNPNDDKITFRDFCTPEAKRALLIGIGLLNLNQFNGCFAMMNYTASVFAEAGSVLSPNLSAIIVGMFQLIGCAFSTLLVDKLGRKNLLVISAFGNGISMAIFGLSNLQKVMGNDSLAWVPLVSFGAAIISSSLGLLTLPFLVISEILPTKILNIGISLLMCYLWILVFFVVKFLPMVTQLYGLYTSTFIFSISSFLGGIFILALVPETKGKCYHEIMEMLVPKKPISLEEKV